MFFKFSIFKEFNGQQSQDAISDFSVSYCKLHEVSCNWLKSVY